MYVTELLAVQQKLTLSINLQINYPSIIFFFWMAKIKTAHELLSIKTLLKGNKSPCPLK